MASEAAMTLERTVGRLEATVGGMVEQLRLLTANIEADRKERKEDCSIHWEATRALQQEMITERGARETVLADARAAKETLAAAALVAQTKTAQDAVEVAETRANFESMKADAIAAAAETARTVLASDAKEAKRAIVYETDERRTQTHWLVERIESVSKWLVPLLIAGAAYLLGADLKP